MDIKKPKSIDLGFFHEKQFLQSSSTNETKQKKSNPTEIELQVWGILIGILDF